MPLLDHFHPPLSRRRRWESFLSAWVEALARRLNCDLLPPQYFAEVHVKVGSPVEIDAPLTFTHPDVFEVQVLNDEQGPHVVAAIELVSPANKDCAAHRRLFAVKCASYLQQNIGLLIVDVVTERAGN